MKQSLIAVAIAATLLTGCSREEETAVVPETSSVPSSAPPVATTPDSGTGSMGASPSAPAPDSSMPPSSSPAPSGAGPVSPTEGGNPPGTPASQNNP
jgi:hypothetical protein